MMTQATKKLTNIHTGVRPKTHTVAGRAAGHCASSKILMCLGSTRSSFHSCTRPG